MPIYGKYRLSIKKIACGLPALSEFKHNKCDRTYELNKSALIIKMSY